MEDQYLDDYVEQLLYGEYFNNEELMDLGDPSNRIDDLVMQMLETYEENEHQLARGRVRRVNDARPSHVAGPEPDLIDILNMPNAEYRNLQPGERAPNYSSYDIGTNVPYEFTVAEFIDAMRRVGDRWDIDVESYLTSAWLTNVKFKDPRDRRIKSFSLRLLEALMDAVYDEGEVPTIFTTKIHVGKNSQFSIQNKNKPTIMSRARRDKMAAGTDILHCAIESPDLFIPHSDSFCIEEVYNHVTGSGPFGFVRRCMELWEKHLDVIIPFGFEELEKLSKPDQMEFLINEGIKPLLVSRETYRDAKGRLKYFKEKHKVIIKFRNGSPTFNLYYLGKLFGSNVHCYDPLDIRVHVSPVNKRAVKFTDGDWVLVFFYMNENNREAKIIFRPSMLSGDLDTDAHLESKSRGVFEHDLFHKNLLHCAAVKWKSKSQDFEKDIEYAFNHQAKFNCGNLMPDEVKQTECGKLKSSVPHKSFAVKGNQFNIDYMFDIETTQRAEDQDQLQGRIPYKNQENVMFPVIPYAIAAQRLFIPWNAKYERYKWQEQDFLREPDDIYQELAQNNRPLESIWDKKATLNLWNKQWEQSLEERNVYPEGYIEEYIHPLDYHDDRSSPIARFLSRIILENLQMLNRCYTTKGVTWPRYININLYAYNGHRFDHPIILQDNFWGHKLDLSSINPNMQMKHYWQKTNIIGSWSNIKAATMTSWINIGKSQFSINVKFYDPINFIAPKCSLDEYTKSKVLSHRHRKKGINHDLINIENALDMKEEVCHYLKYDVYLLGLATIHIMDTMIIMTNQASKSQYTAPDTLWSRHNFKVPPKVYTIEKDGKFINKLDELPMLKPEYGLPEGLTMHSLCMTSPFIFTTCPSTARRFLKWNDVSCEMVTSATLRKYINETKTGGRTQVIKTKYKNFEFAKLETKFPLFKNRPFDDMQYCEYMKAKKKVTGCVYDDSLVSLKDSNGIVNTMKYQPKEPRKCHCNSKHCFDCILWVKNIIIPQKVENLQNTSWKIPDKMIEYLRSTKKSSDLLPEHFEIPIRTKVIEWEQFTGVHDEPMISYDANSLYPSAYADQPMHVGKIYPWHSYPIILNTAQDFEDHNLFGIVTFDEVFPPKKPNPMPRFSIILNDRELNRMDKERKEKLKNGDPTISSGALLWMENEMHNCTIDTISAIEMANVGWTFGNITSGLVFTKPTWAIGQIMIDLYNARNYYKNHPDYGKGCTEEQTMKLAMNSIYGQSKLIDILFTLFISFTALMRDFIGNLMLSSVHDVTSMYRYDFKIKDEEIQVNNLMKSWVEIPYDFYADDISKTGMAHQIAVELLAATKRIMNRLVDVLNPYQPNIYYTDTDSVYVNGKWSRKLQSTNILVNSTDIHEKISVPMEGEDYLGQFKVS